MSGSANLLTALYGLLGSLVFLSILFGFPAYLLHNARRCFRMGLRPQSAAYLIGVVTYMACIGYLFIFISYHID